MTRAASCRSRSAKTRPQTSTADDDSTLDEAVQAPTAATRNRVRQDRFCDDGQCVDGCSEDAPCAGDELCCDGMCLDTSADDRNCGSCGNMCSGAVGATGHCEASSCVIECDVGRTDCNDDPSDGCEGAGGCSCTPEESQGCYTSDPATIGVGECAEGSQTCNDFGTAFTTCLGSVTPITEVCDNGLDDDCDGEIDEIEDEDGDGFTNCASDCCDTPNPSCASPELVNPGAVEVDGNGVDDDCDGEIDNVARDGLRPRAGVRLG